MSDHPQITRLLRRHGLNPRKYLGQNFLSDPHILEQIRQAADYPFGAQVLEIGPGLGTLTRVLARSAGRVVAVELDERLAGLLEDEFSAEAQVEIVRGDILALDPQTWMGDAPYYVAANIPYNITSAVFRHLLESANRPQRMALTVQEEVAERICALPGDMSLLALSVQVYGQPSIALRIPASAFYPQPKVNSAVVRVDLLPQPRIPSAQLEDFFRLIRAGFSQKRKTLRNSLSAGLHIAPAQGEALLRSAGIDPSRRAETLAISEWQRLVEALQKMDRPA